MRSDKELLELLLEDLDTKMTVWGNKSLCFVTVDMEQYGLISKEEESRIDEIIMLNPTEYRKNHYLHFPPFDVESRKEYLKQLIEKYS